MADLTLRAYMPMIYKQRACDLAPHMAVYKLTTCNLTACRLHCTPAGGMTGSEGVAG